MKKIILALALTLTYSVSHADDVFAQCVTDYPTTSFVIETVKDRVNVRVIHHNGVKYAPFWNSMVVGNDLSFLKTEADLLMNLNEVTEVSWKTSDCKITGDKKFVCIGQTDSLPVNGMNIEPWAAYSSYHTESSFAGDFSYVEMTLRYYINNQAHQMFMKYSPHECLVSNKEIVKEKKK